MQQGMQCVDFCGNLSSVSMMQCNTVSHREFFPFFKWRRGEPWNSGELSADGRGMLSATKGGGKGRKEGFFSSHSWSCCNNEKPSGTLLLRYVSCGGGNSPFFAFLGAMESN